MCRLSKDACEAAAELAEKLSKNSWFIGIIVTASAPFDFIVCSREGNSPQVIENVKVALDRINPPSAHNNVFIGWYDDSVVKVFSEGGEFAEKFYKTYLERVEKCSGRFEMLTN